MQDGQHRGEEGGRERQDRIHWRLPFPSGHLRGGLPVTRLDSSTLPPRLAAAARRHVVSPGGRAGRDQKPAAPGVVGLRLILSLPVCRKVKEPAASASVNWIRFWGQTRTPLATFGQGDGASLAALMERPCRGAV